MGCWPSSPSLVLERIFSRIRVVFSWPLGTQHLNHRNLRVDLGRDKCWIAFSPSQNSEFWTITLPPQQAKTTRMRLKMRSNTREGEDGQQPITSDHCEGQHLTDFSFCCAHLYSYSCIWLRVGTRKSNSCSHSSSVSPSCSTKFKNTNNLPQWTSVKYLWMKTF